MVFRQFLQLFWVSSILLSGSALAEKADRDKIMYIQSEFARIDNFNQVKILTKNVILNKGTMQILGEKLELRQEAEGYNHARLTARPGERAFFRQKREGVDEFIEGEAEVIDYDDKTMILRLKNGSILRQYRGATLAASISANLINYDSGNDTFDADGSLSSNSGGTGRVKMMLLPKPQVHGPVDATDAVSLQLDRVLVEPKN